MLLLFIGGWLPLVILVNLVHGGVKVIFSPIFPFAITFYVFYILLY